MYPPEMLPGEMSTEDAILSMNIVAVALLLLLLALQPFDWIVLVVLIINVIMCVHGFYLRFIDIQQKD